MSDYLSAISALFAVTALVASVTCWWTTRRAYFDSKTRRRIDKIELEIAEQNHLITTISQSVKRMTARENMRKARAKKAEQSDTMSDDEWRHWATKRIQLRQPIE